LTVTRFLQLLLPGEGGGGLIASIKRIYDHSVQGKIGKGEESEANACLIAAAPDLLKVAEGCRGYFAYVKQENSDFTPDPDWLKPLLAAIRKANGNT